MTSGRARNIQLVVLLTGCCVALLMLSWEHYSSVERHFEYVARHLEYTRVTAHEQYQNRMRYKALQLDYSRLAEKRDPLLLTPSTSGQHDEQSMRIKNMRSLGWVTPKVYVGNVLGSGFDARWTSQAGQDRTISRLFDGKRRGYFIDLAANEAVAYSNTFTLEQEYDWYGLCIEANPKYFDQLYLRNCQVVQAAVGRVNNELVDFKFQDVFGGVIGSSFDNTNALDDRGRGPSIVKTQATISLAHIFKTLSVPRVIDYMSLDIEGAEEWVFETFPWANYTILVMTVERPKQGLVHRLLANEYFYVCDHGDFGDQLWMHTSFPNRTAAVAGLGLNGRTVCA